jgi:hypothetical protein
MTPIENATEFRILRRGQVGSSPEQLEIFRSEGTRLTGAPMSTQLAPRLTPISREG